MSDEKVDALIQRMREVEVPWDGPVKDVQGWNPEACYQERSLKGDLGYVTVSALNGLCRWNWWRNFSGQCSAEHPGSLEDAWAEVDLYLRGWLVLRLEGA